jgi:hypothetical protein
MTTICEGYLQGRVATLESQLADAERRLAFLADPLDSDALVRAVGELREWLDDLGGQGSRTELQRLSERLLPLVGRLDRPSDIKPANPAPVEPREDNPSGETEANKGLRDAGREYAKAWDDYANDPRKAAACRALEGAARAFVAATPPHGEPAPPPPWVDLLRDTEGEYLGLAEESPEGSPERARWKTRAAAIRDLAVRAEERWGMPLVWWPDDTTRPSMSVVSPEPQGAQLLRETAAEMSPGEGKAMVKRLREMTASDEPGSLSEPPSGWSVTCTGEKWWWWWSPAQRGGAVDEHTGGTREQAVAACWADYRGHR